MKRGFTKLMAAFALLMFLIPSITGWAQQITWTAADQGYGNGDVIESVDFNDYVAGEFFKGTNNNPPKYYTTGAAIRCYGGNYFTITSDYILTEISFGFASGEGSNAITSDVGTYEDGTWTGNANEVTFTINGTSGHRRFATFTITYDEGGNPSPVINANNVEIAYDATEGAIEYTINNGVDGGVLSAATEAEWLTIGTVGETVPFTCSVNDNGERVATVTLTYTYDTDQTVTKNVTVTQATNPNGPGSEANPYTVAQARAAIDAGTGTQGVYATGIVSAIPTAWNTQYNNITFNFVDNQGDTDFLQAYRCVSGSGVDASTVAVGDVVVVYGNLTKYGSTYEFAQNCQVVSLEHPVSTEPSVTVTPATINAPAEGAEGTLEITYENIPDLISFDYYFCDANGGELEDTDPNYPDWIGAEINEENDAYIVSYTINPNDGEARTAYMKVYTIDVPGNEEVYAIVTINQEEYVVPALDYAELPFEFNGGRADIEGTDGLTQEGLGTDYNANSNPTTKLKFDGTGDWMLLHFLEAPGTLLFDIKGNSFNGGTFTVQTSVDGETYEDLVAYTELGDVDTKTIDNLGEDVRYIKWIYTEKSQGNVGLGNIYLYELGGGPAPAASITVGPDVVNVDAEEHDGTLDLTYENLTISDMTDFDIQYYNAEGQEAEEPTWIEVVVAEQDPTIGEGYVVSYIMNENNGEARSAYFKVYAMDDETNLVYSNLVTVNQAAYVVPALDYAELPFEFNGGRADIENTDGLTQEGLGTDYNANSNPTTKLKFDGTGDWMLLHFNEAPGTLLFDIKGNGFNGGTFTVQTSEDGETYEDLVAYTELGDVDTKTIDNLGEDVRYIKWIYTEKSQGNVGLGNIYLYELGGGPAPVASIMVEFDEIEVTATGEDDYAAITYENLEITQASDFDIRFYDAAGAPLDEQPDWMSAEVTTQIGEEGYFVYYVIDDNEGEARTAYFKVYALDANAELVYSNLVTVSQEAYVTPPVPGEWVMTRLADLTEDDVFVIVGVYDVNEAAYAMPNNSTGAPSAVEVTMVGNTLSGDIDDNLQWNLSIGEDGYTFYPNGETETWLYCTNANNGVRVGTGDYNVFSMTSEGYLFNNGTNRYIGIYNSQDWRCYTSINNNIKEQTFAFYKRVDVSEIQTYTLDITGYGDTDGGYYLIASPVSMIRPITENGFLTDAYDLYYFDQAEEDAWRNYEAKHFNIASGKGYLYASQESTTLTFTGIPYEGNGDIALDYDEDAPFGGWNLIGNPFSTTATLDHDFYILNPDGSELVASESEEVYPMQGVFVQADAANQIAHFNNGTTGTTPGVIEDKLNLRVSNGNGISDFARIRFGEGHNLEKFQLNPNSTKLYFPQGENDYAVVYSTNEGEMPVNFKAAENGTYTISINPENVIIDYLHLIDNMTGMDIDLLQTPDYSFEATVNDNAARFTLVFAGLTGVEENNANSFAFFNGSEWVINNMGEASLQMVDMTGRIVSSANINGNATLHSDNLSAGAYVIRLVNGENVKSQKVIIK